MKTDYRIEPDGGEFILVDASGETVGVYPSQDAAKQDIARCEQEDAMYETAKQLVATAVKAHMQMHGVDRETASYWIRSAAETVD